MTTLSARRLKLKTLPRFVPVIFANGEDDDAPGLQACFDDEPVQYENRIYEPGEAVTIFGRHLILSRAVIARCTTGRWTHIHSCLISRHR